MKRRQLLRKLHAEPMRAFDLRMASELLQHLANLTTNLAKPVEIPLHSGRRPRNGRAAADNCNEGNSNGESNEEAIMDERGRASLEDAGTGENENKRGCS